MITIVSPFLTYKKTIMPQVKMAWPRVRLLLHNCRKNTKSPSPPSYKSQGFPFWLQFFASLRNDTAKLQLRKRKMSSQQGGMKYAFLVGWEIWLGWDEIWFPSWVGRNMVSQQGVGMSTYGFFCERTFSFFLSLRKKIYLVSFSFLNSK